MTGLYPIIRRVRRPLIAQDDDAGPPSAPPAVPLVQPEAPASLTKNVRLPRKRKNATANANQAKE